MKWILFICLFFNITFYSQAQLSDTLLQKPEVGKPCPELLINNIDFYSKKKVALKDFKGKWLILDFWDKYCSSCITSFPHISAEQIELGDSAQFLMIAFKDFPAKNRDLFSKYHKALNLSVPSAFIDSTMYWSWVPGGLPYTIVVDPKGIVRAMTNKVSLNTLKDLMAGRNPWISDGSFSGYQRKAEIQKKYDRKIPFGIFGNGTSGNNFMYRSFLCRWEPGMPTFWDSRMAHDETEINLYNNRGRFELVQLDLSGLYRAAFTGVFQLEYGNLVGEFWPQPILEVKDSSVFKRNFQGQINLFCYSLTVSPEKATKEYMMGVMQNDLKNYFGFNAHIESRKMPYWRLIATDKARSTLKSKSEGELKATIRGKEVWMGADYKNCPIERFVNTVELYTGFSPDSDPPIVDETGIRGNIDISVRWFKSDLKSVKKTLQENGLDLVEGQKEMKVLIIRD
jgi:thiol-disulfide isomerase/thioredoxin